MLAHSKQLGNASKALDLPVGQMLYSKSCHSIQSPPAGRLVAQQSQVVTNNLLDDDRNVPLVQRHVRVQHERPLDVALRASCRCCISCGARHLTSCVMMASRYGTRGCLQPSARPGSATPFEGQVLGMLICAIILGGACFIKEAAGRAQALESIWRPRKPPYDPTTSGSMRYTTALLSASAAASGPFVPAVKSLPFSATCQYRPQPVCTC